MANLQSAKKMMRKIARRTTAARIHRTRMRGLIHAVEEAITAGQKDTAHAAFKSAEPKIQRAAQRNIIHKNTARRKIARLARRINALST